MSLTIEIKTAEKDIIGSKQVGSKEGYHGYGQDIPIMEDYVKHKKGDKYIVVTRSGWESDFPSEYEEFDLVYVLYDIVQYIESQEFDCDKLWTLLGENREIDNYEG